MEDCNGKSEVRSQKSEEGFWKVLPAFLAGLLLTACSTSPPYAPPVVDVPCEWHSPTSAGMTCCLPNDFQWWQSLNDPTLSRLIERAYQQNVDLYIAATRILEARAHRRNKTSDLKPHVDLSAAPGHIYYSKDALVNGLLGPANQNGIRRNVNFFELGFDADWEIDLFGVTLHELKALQAEVEASEESLCDIWLTLSAEVARNYVELRGLQHRLTLIDKNIAAQIDTVHLTDVLLQRGITSDVDQHQAQEQLSTLSAQRPLVQLAIDKAIHRLSILLGYAPGDLYCELSTPQPLPTIPCDKPIGVPSELLRRRPDIRKAERELAAASERVCSAVAAQFPRLSLRGFIGDISTNLPSLFTPGANTWIAFPQLLAPIFNSHLIQQDIELNKLIVQQACFQYQKVVLEALEEAENAIASFHCELERCHQLADANRASGQALLLTHDLYQRGVKDYLAVLVIDRSHLAAEDAYVQSQVALLSHYIALYKALGGSYFDVSDCDEEED